LATNWNNEVVLITGASSGIGLAIARELAAKGCRLVLLSRRMDRLDSLEAELQQLGAQCFTIQCDVCDERQVHEAVAAAVERFGCIDVVFANAGFGINGRFLTLTNEDYQRQLDTNLFGVMNTLRAAHPYLAQTRGRAVVIGSVNSHLSLNKSSAYAISKFAVRALVQSLWSEWRRDGISVTLICPGYVESEIHRVNNDGVFVPEATNAPPAWLTMPAATAAKKIANAVLKRRREVVITIHGKLAVGLVRHLPWLAHWILSRT